MENFFLARNISNEEIAVSNFLNAYIENLDSSSQKSPTELFSLLLEQLSATCDVVSQEIATSESEGLLDTNQFFESIVRQVQGLEPRKFTLTLNFNDFQTFVNAFQSLKPLAESYPNGSYICNRIDYFTNLLCNAASSQDSAASTKIALLVLMSIMFIVFLIIIIFVDFVDEWGETNIWGYIMYGCLIGSMLIAGFMGSKSKD